jgi:L-ascorbate metabolism protein UlaG (beta-lactamase superfamily)
MVSKENLKLVTITHTWEDIHLDKKWRFFHPALSYRPSMKVLLNWRKWKNTHKKEKKMDKFILPLFDPKDFLASKKDGIVWLGHASFFIRVWGISFLTDPVYYKLPLIKTISHLPNIFPKLPPIDYLLISHDHRDHFDVRTLKKISALSPRTEVLTGIGMKSLFKKFPFNEIQTAGWYQKYDTKGAEVYFLPARHRSKRTLLDTNKRLWGSFLIKAGWKTLYFWGDSGYENHFKEIWKLFPDIDYAFLGIWWYAAKWFIHPNHTTPSEALDAMKDLWAKKMIPMHYGTFDITHEPSSQPLRFLKKECEIRHLSKEVTILGLGESIEF